MGERKSLSKKLRFEVFKRDKFTCQYCGRKAPDIVLRVDHVHPVAEGGTDEILNLITSCHDCNAGKGARLLSDESVVTKQRAQIEALAERREQIDMMLEWSRQMSDCREQELDLVIDRINEVSAGFYVSDLGRKSVRKWMRKYTVVELYEAIGISAEQYLQTDKNGEVTSDSWGKFFNSIPGIARVRRLPEDERDLFYVRGIVRNRMGCDEHAAIQLLRGACAAGASIDELKDLARSADSWGEWVERMEEYTDAR